MANNEEFLTAIFGDQYGEAHVTSFSDDPNNLTRDNHLQAWFGGRFKNYNLKPGNQYFTISIFTDDEKGVARRRKANFIATHCIVLDDVKEKLSLDQARKLPEPSWILETSAGSEQWGYILNTPCTDRARVENLLDGLVENGLAPNGKDPGMKGVTRYVRLPEGTNNKSNKTVNGIAFNCRLTVWEPDRKCSLSELAVPFFVDLDKPRRESRIDGAGLVEDHPILQHQDILPVREIRSDGRYEVRCPWVEEHTHAVDNGAAIFTNTDGSLGFKCHHGACEGRSGYNLLQWFDSKIDGFTTKYKHWQLMKSFSDITTPLAEEKTNVPEAPKQTDDVYSVLDKLHLLPPNSDDHISISHIAIKMIDEVDAARQIVLYKRLRDEMTWSERDLAKVKKEVLSSKKESRKDLDFFSDDIYVAEQNQFFNRRKVLWLTVDAYQNNYGHLDGEAKKQALTGGRVVKVDKIDYAPKMPAVYKKDCGTIIGNTWHRGTEREGVEGDVTPWLEHFNQLGWGEYRDHVLKWMAFTIRYPEQKINHMLILGGLEGSGKDWILTPLIEAMSENNTTISGEELLKDFDGYIMNTKHLHVNEVEPSDRQEAAKIYRKLKPYAAAPPKTLRSNEKRLKPVEITNLLSVSMTTNSKMVLATNGSSRRIFALWSDLDVRNKDGSMKHPWRMYWRKNWQWMENGGIDACIHHLRNKVDLSDFYASEAPPLSPFLQEITQQSEQPLFSAPAAPVPPKPNVISFL